MSNPFSQELKFSAGLFVGRKREIWGTLDRLANPQSRGSSAVYGEIGIGKSWFLERLKQPDLLSEWELEAPNVTLISLNCQEVDPWSPVAFWQIVLRKLQVNNIPTSEQEFIKKFLDVSVVDNLLMGQLLDQIVKNGRFLTLLLDNFEWVINCTDPENPIFLNALRSLLVREKKGLGIVLTTAELLHELCQPFHFDVSPFDNVFYPVELKSFNQEEASYFIETHLKDTRIRFNEGEKQNLFKFSQGHPDLLKEFCYQLFKDKSENVL